jgi:hypothetical protein
MHLYRILGASLAMLLLTVGPIWAQTDTTTVPPKLPFAIAKEKEIDQEELDAKKEGVSVTGVPDTSSDPINCLERQHHLTI